MATFGGKYAIWAPIISDDSDKALPVYGQPLTLGSQNKTEETVATGSASMHGDDKEKIRLEEFTSGTLDVQVVALLPSTEATIYGPATDENDTSGMSYGGDDRLPYGCYGTTNRRISEDGDVTFRVLFWPRVKAAVQGETVQTKESTLSPAYEKVKFNFSQCLAGVYKITKEFDTEAAAKAFLDGLVAGTVAAPGLVPAKPSGGNGE